MRSKRGLLAWGELLLAIHGHTCTAIGSIRVGSTHVRCGWLVRIVDASRIPTARIPNLRIPITSLLLILLLLLIVVEGTRRHKLRGAGNASILSSGGNSITYSHPRRRSIRGRNHCCVCVTVMVVVVVGGGVDVGGSSRGLLLRGNLLGLQALRLLLLAALYLDAVLAEEVVLMRKVTCWQVRLKKKIAKRHFAPNYMY